MHLEIFHLQCVSTMTLVKIAMYSFFIEIGLRWIASNHRSRKKRRMRGRRQYRFYRPLWDASLRISRRGFNHHRSLTEAVFAEAGYDTTSLCESDCSISAPVSIFRKSVISGKSQ